MPHANWSATAIAAESVDIAAVERAYHEGAELVPKEQNMPPDVMPQRKPELPILELTAAAVDASFEPAVHEGEHAPQLHELPNVVHAQPERPGLGWSLTRPCERRYVAALSATVSQVTVLVPKSGLFPLPVLEVVVISHTVSPRKWRKPFVLVLPSQLAIGTLHRHGKERAQGGIARKEVTEGARKGMAKQGVICTHGAMQHRISTAGLTESS